MSEADSLVGIRGQLYILGLIRFTEAIAWTSIFPYVPFMVASFPSVRQADVAFYSGALVAIFTFCEFLSGMFWARISDRLGRKSTLLFGLFGGIVSALTFGFSRTLWLALLARAIGGLTNPNVGVVPTCVGELATRKEQQAKAFSIIPFLRGMGNLVGPVLGGLLADLAKHHPATFGTDTMWTSYPYLLANLMVIALSSMSFALGVFFLVETCPRMAHHQDIGLRAGNWLCQLFSRNYGKPLSPGYVQVDNDEIDAYSPDATPHAPMLGSPQDIELEDAQTPVKQLPNVRAFTPQVILQVLSVSLLAWTEVSSGIIVPTFLAHPRGALSPGQSAWRSNQGLGLDTRQIGTLLLCQAIVAILAQYFLVHRMINHFGALKAYRIILWILPWLYLLTPLISSLDPSPSLVAMAIDLMLKIICLDVGFVCSSILLTNTSPAPEHLAPINGATASFGCLARAIGPMVTGTLFGWGVQHNIIGVAFWSLTVVAFSGAAESFVLRDRP